MSERVALLKEFHATKRFGSQDNLVRRQRSARELHRSLTVEEIEELAEFAIEHHSDDRSGNETILLYLSCFQPGSLTPFHARLVESDIFYFAPIYHGAEAEISRGLVEMLTDDEDPYELDDILCTLAWIGDENVQRAFDAWRTDPPPWRASLHIPPHQYANVAGWELTEEGSRRNLFTEATYPLVSPNDADVVSGPVKVGLDDSEFCKWCNRKLAVLLDLNLSEDRLGFLEITADRLQVVTCDVCTCYGPIFFKIAGDGRASWDHRNTKPNYLPQDSENWERFPGEALVLSSRPRHFLEACDWSLPVSFSQLGGHPAWIQDAEFPECPDCGKKMSFLGQISNEDIRKYGEGIFYMFICRDCGVTATEYQQS